MTLKPPVPQQPPVQAQAPAPVKKENTGSVSKPSQPIDENMIDMKYLVKALVKYGASDLHIKVGRPPLFRINGNLVPAKMPEITQDQAQKILIPMLSGRQQHELEEKKQIDFSFGSKNLGRFRCNVYYQQTGLAAAVRMIPLTIPRLEDLNLPPVIKELCNRPRGIVLVTGSTGSGKSTTLSAMVNYINENHHVHILSIEDPIEFVHHDIKASITQREVGSDTHTLQDALFAGLRQDPDIILISELRNLETIQTALTAAETGHLVMSTLHTNDAKGTIDRILDVFPAEARQQVRVQLSASLVGIVSQQLISKVDDSGRVAACEIMVKSPTIENYILKNELDKIQDAMAQSGDYYKMQTMNQALEKLINAGTITLEEALKCTSNPSDLKLKVSGLNADRAYGIEKDDDFIEHFPNVPKNKSA